MTTSRVEKRLLPDDSPGTSREIACYRFGPPGARPKVYLQAGLHADEMPGVLVLQHLMRLLEGVSLRGEVVVVPLANPIGFAQWVQGKPQGRQDLATMKNFNRGFPDLSSVEVSPSAPVEDIRAAFRAALETPAPDAITAQRLVLMEWSHDADHVLDLHCDHHSVVHLYASPARPEVTAALSAALGARLVLLEEVSGGNAFDEAHTAPWAALRRRLGEGVPQACFSATVELRGQFDVSDALAAEDAQGLMRFLAAVGVLDGPTPGQDQAVHYPLSGSLECFAPQGGVVTWETTPGETVTEGQTLGHVTDPMTRSRLPILAPTSGMIFRQELWRHCLRGQGLAHVAGPEPRAPRGSLSD